MEHIIHNVQTNTIEKVPYTEAEILEAQKILAIWAEKETLRNAKQKVKDDAKAALLARLGITAEEATLLLS